MKIFNKDKINEIKNVDNILEGKFEREEINGETALVFYPTEIIEDVKEDKINYLVLEREVEEIIDWFVNNDWKINKVLLGEWETSDARFLKYKQERLKNRNRQDEIRKILDNRS